MDIGIAQAEGRVHEATDRQMPGGCVDIRTPNLGGDDVQCLGGCRLRSGSVSELETRVHGREDHGARRIDGKRHTGYWIPARDRLCQRRLLVPTNQFADHAAACRQTDQNRRNDA